MFGLMLPAWFTKNPVLMWGAAIIAGLAALRVSNEIAEARGRRQMRERVEAKARRVQEKVRETLDEKSSQTADARDSVRADIRATGRLPDNLRKQWVSDYADSGGS